MGADAVLARRRAEQRELLERARRYVAELSKRVPLRAAVVFGSVARGDFNRWSDLDLLLISAAFQGTLLGRLDSVEPRPPLVQPVPWTLAEWRVQLARNNPIAKEAGEAGIWLIGSAGELADDTASWTREARPRSPATPP